MLDKKKAFLLSSVIIAALPATPLSAQAAEKSIASGAQVSADTIIVTATRTKQEAWKTAQSVSVIDRDEIERSQDVEATDLLRRLPGVTVTRSGGPGQPSSVLVRGADNAQSLVLVDGVRINDPSDVGGGFDFGSLLVGAFDRVEVVRGSQSAVWGSQAIGGVINFRTPEAGGEWTGRASAEYGARDRINVNGAASGSAGPVGLSFGADYLDTDGYSAFSEFRGGREKDGFEGISVFGKAELGITSELSVSAGGFYTDNEYEFDTATGDADNYGEKRDLTGFAFAEYESETVDARAGYTLTDTHRLSEQGFGPFITDGRRELIEAVATVRPMQFVSLIVGAESEDSEFRDNFGTSADSGIDSAFGQVNLSLYDMLSVNAGLRYDDHEDYGDETSFSASAALRPIFGSDLAIRASYGEGYRAPSLYQRNYNAGPFVMGPVLLAERAKSYDLGITLPFADTGAFEVTGFRRTVDNQLDFDNAGFFYYNIDSRAQGVELAFNYGGPQFDVRLSYTYLDAENRATGADLPRRAKNNFFAGIDWRPLERLSLGADLTHGGRRFDDVANSVLIGDYTTLDLRAAFDLTDNFALYGRVENVTDKEYELASGYGQPDRNATVGVRARF